MEAITRTSLIILCFVLSACGGGGGGGSAPPPPTTSPTTQFPIAGALSAYVQSAHSYNLTATDTQNNAYTVHLTTAPGPGATLAGHATSTADSSFIIKKNGAVIDVSSSTAYFFPSPYELILERTSTGECDITRDRRILPSYATIGQSGPFYAYDTWACDANLKAQGFVSESSTTAVWSLAADTPATAWFCLNYTTIERFLGTPSTGSECYKVDQSGNVSALTVAFTTTGGETITFR